MSFFSKLKSKFTSSKDEPKKIEEEPKIEKKIEESHQPQPIEQKAETIEEVSVELTKSEEIPEPQEEIEPIKVEEAVIESPRVGKEQPVQKLEVEEFAPEIKSSESEVEIVKSVEAEEITSEVKTEVEPKAEVKIEEKPEEKSGLSKSAFKITSGLRDIFTKKKLDDDSLEELEELLISADMGPKTSAKIVAEFSKNKFGKEVSDDEVKESLATQIAEIITKSEKKLESDWGFLDKGRPQVLKFVGVNGTGKTTTIGKMASKQVESGKKVMIAACDTFRAAAVEQLKTWAERSGAIFHHGEDQADPASVAFSAYERAVKEGVDILMIDTAGRLHNKKQLMEELAKISRVLKKKSEDIPDETILVLDSTTGQNAVFQTENFIEIDNVSGLIVTKLDGSAKGGVVVNLCDRFDIPVYAVGVGEGINDLKEFSAEEFAKALISS